MLKQLDNYDREEAFEYADFDREDVEEIIASADGENDGDPWLMLVKLKNGIYGYLKAWCDYTGWDCQAGGHSETDADMDNLIKMKIGKEDRARLGKQIPEDGLVNP